MEIFVSLTLFDGFCHFLLDLFHGLENHSGFLQSENKKFADFRYLYLFKAFTEVSLMSLNNPLVGNPATVLTKKKLKGEFKTSFTRCINSKKNSKWFTFCFTFSFEWEIVVMSLTFFGVLPESCLVRRKKDEQGSHLSWNREILLRL